MKTQPIIHQTQRRFAGRAHQTSPGWLVWTLGLAAAALRAADTTPSSVNALKQLSLEELANLSVTSTSKREEKASDAPAALFVLTPGEITRSGARTIPEALRLVPGLDVARVNGNDWAISSRGFNEAFANKLLVMVDGRTVYTPLFSGVYWQVQDVVLEDLDRIEVVRGPGGTLWGANAVNGVINLISKPARETLGTHVSGGGGTEVQGFGQVRHGFQTSENSWARVYGKSSIRDNTPMANGDPANDRAHHSQGGFRYDWEPDSQRMLTFQGDVYAGKYDQTFVGPSTDFPYIQTPEVRIETLGANALTRWTQHFEEGSTLQIQAYFDHAEQGSRPALSGGRGFSYDQVVDTFDLDIQQQWRLGERHQVVVGGGYRLISDDFQGNQELSLDPGERVVHWANGFVQDEITLVPDHLAWVVGAKVEHNDYTGWEFQPNTRLRWTPTESQTLWAAVSRAARIPSRAESDVRRPVQFIPAQGPAQPPTLLKFTGSPEYESEYLIAYELGYRVRPWKIASFDVTGFINDYDNLRTFEQGAPDLSTLPDYVTVPVIPGNQMQGRTYGGEFSVRLEPVPRWKLRASYTLLKMELETEAGSLDTASPAIEGNSPRHQFLIHSSLDLPANLQFDAVFRWIDELPALGVDAYPSLDLRLAWSPKPRWEIAVVGQNLLDNRHAESGGVSLSGSVATEVPRSAYLRVSFNY